MSGSGAPADYAELFDTYYDMVRYWVRRAHIVEQDVDDVALELIVKFIEKNGLENYDPQRVWPSGRRAKFSTMFSSFVKTYVMSLRDTQMNLYRREVLVDDYTEAFYEEAYGAGLEFDEWVQEVVTYLRSRPQHGSDTAAVFLAMVDRLARDEPIARREVVIGVLGGSASKATAVMRDLRKALVAGGFA